jgi:hypothetical protein
MPNFPSEFDYDEIGSGKPTYADNQYYVRDPQRWQVDQEHLRHNQALWMIGEYTFFCLMWHIEDFQAGLVGRCQRCYISQGKIAQAYGQPRQNKCSDCYGTTFEGGIRALIVRPAIFADTDEGEKFDKRGVVHDDDVNVEATADFRVRNYDYAFRQDGSRWMLRVPQRVTVRTGFEHPYQTTTAITYNNMRAQVEDPTSVAYTIPPAPATVTTTLRQGRYEPFDFSTVEVINGPLIPGGTLED